VLRSGSRWSLGCQKDHVEQSIYEAYLAHIAKAEHFIYIENQFFISSQQHDDQIKNKIVQALADKITECMRQNRTFRVIILLPNWPEGSLTKDMDVQVLMYWELMTAVHGPTSLLNRVCRAAYAYSRSPADYLSICCLRSHSVLADGPVAEQIYVHSKLMIVDDRYVICGSANINDRSMLGDRDSEVCLLISPGEEVSSTMDGQPWKAGKYAHSLRCHLWAEHLGFEGYGLTLSPQHQMLISDPVCSRVYHDLWRSIAAKNSTIYEEAFPHMPSNAHTTLEEFERSHDGSKPGSSDPLISVVIDDSEMRDTAMQGLGVTGCASSAPPIDEDYEIKPPVLCEAILTESIAQHIQGHLCVWPTEFLARTWKEDLKPTAALSLVQYVTT